MPANNPCQLNPLRSVTAGKYVRYLTHEDISGGPYSFPLSSIRRNPFHSNEQSGEAKVDIDKSRLTGENISNIEFFG